MPGGRGVSLGVAVLADVRAGVTGSSCGAYTSLAGDITASAGGRLDADWLRLDIWRDKSRH